MNSVSPSTTPKMSAFTIVWPSIVYQVSKSLDDRRVDPLTVATNSDRLFAGPGDLRQTLDNQF